MFLLSALHVIAASLSLSPIVSLLCSASVVGGVSSDGWDAEVMEGGERSAGGSDESPSEAEFLSGAQYEQTSPDCSEDMEDSDSLASEQLLSPGCRPEGAAVSCSPAWALAFSGEDSFSPDVLQYAGSLGQHTGAPSVEAKTQVGGAWR